MRGKYPLSIFAGRNITVVLNQLRNREVRNFCRFKFSDQEDEPSSSSRYRSSLPVLGLVAIGGTVLMQMAESEEKKLPEGYSRDAYLTNMETLIRTYCPRILNLPEELLAVIIEQLDWAQQNTFFTPQSSVVFDADDNSVKFDEHINREILRALTRIEMLLLIIQTDQGSAEDLRRSYEEFTRDQSQSKKLSYSDFCALVKEFDISESEIDAQIRAVLIGAVTLSPPAKGYLSKTRYENYPYDSVQFSGFTVSLMPQMYPAYARSGEDVKRLIHFAFPNDKRHWRHMFYLENNSAFQAFEEADLTPEAVSFWKRYWLVNAFGFVGHTKFGSALFFDDSVALRANLLHQAIDLRLKNPNVNTADTYAKLCADRLQIRVNKDEALLLTRIMTMTNLMTIDDARKMLDALRNYPEHAALVQLHKQTFNGDVIVTYLPALLDNVLSASSNMGDVIAAFHWANKIIPGFRSNNPLSFRCMNRDAVKTLIAARFSEDVLTINEKGEVSAQVNLGNKLDNKVERPFPQ